MIDWAGLADPRIAWWLAAILLAIAEMVVPGVFLIWLAAAAALVALVTTVIVPPPAAQFALFAAASVASIYAGRRVMRRIAVPADPLLNDRAARLIGTRVILAQAIVAGEGRARVADTLWPATGPDLPAGAAAIVVEVIGNRLVVVPAGD